MNTSRTLNRDEVAALQAELDQVRAEVVADLGDKDARYIRRVIRVQRYSALAGRIALFFGFNPITWPLGVFMLSVAKILENMEIGHNVMHGQYDWMHDPKLNSQTYEWDNVGTSDDWRHTHNYKHHTYTNILGKDEDLGYDVIRITPEQRWTPATLFQPLYALTLGTLFQWGVAIQNLRLGRYFGKRRKPLSELSERGAPAGRKMLRQLFKDYLFFPLLSGPNFLGTLAGNLVANVVRNLWTWAIIFCGHFPAGARVYTQQETANETRGDWYLRQLNGSANFSGATWFHIMSGHLSHQIEHHMFPDIPAHRYREMAPKVQDICERYGQQYNTASFPHQFATVWGKILRYSLPGPEPRLPQPA